MLLRLTGCPRAHPVLLVLQQWRCLCGTAVLSLRVGVFCTVLLGRVTSCHRPHRPGPALSPPSHLCIFCLLRAAFLCHRQDVSCPMLAQVTPWC